MRDIFLRSRRDALGKKTILAGAAAPLANGSGERIRHVSHFKSAAHFATRALAPSEFMKVPASLASGR
jgi:hypothetical protein